MTVFIASYFPSLYIGEVVMALKYNYRTWIDFDDDENGHNPECLLIDVPLK